jgi:hemerythrin
MSEQTHNTVADEDGASAPSQVAEAEHRVIKRLLSTLQQATELSAIRPVVTTLSELLLEHFEHEESPDGLYEELRLMRPETAAQIDKLEREHRDLVAALEELQGLITQAEALAGQVHEAKGRFVEQLITHEATETGLVVDAWYVDLGESG